MCIAHFFLSSRDSEELKRPSYFYRQDALKHVSGDLEKSIRKFDPDQGKKSGNGIKVFKLTFKGYQTHISTRLDA